MNNLVIEVAAMVLVSDIAITVFQSIILVE